MLPALYAADMGYFAEAGLDAELIAVQGGPAVVAAIASGEADIGYASAASGITDLASVKGKKITFNANGGLCELMWRDHLASVGLTIADVEVVVLPFPEQEAPLEQGNIDATCTFAPFSSSILANAALGASTIGA